MKYYTIVNNKPILVKESVFKTPLLWLKELYFGSNSCSTTLSEYLEAKRYSK